MCCFEVVLVDLAPTVSEDLEGVALPRIAECALDSCTTAQQILEPKQPSCCMSGTKKARGSMNQQVKEKLVKGVMRYVKVKDKYTALLSLLLKSQAFYKAHSSVIDEEGSPVVVLPLTEKGKPFIPKTESAPESESDCYPISVSHQFPYCGLARLALEHGSVNTADMKLGMDIVVFERLRTDLYDTVQDFLQVFRDSFTDWEWQRLHSSCASNQQLMMEFYLRWSMKEAFVKALGLGMYIEFGTFETRLDLVDSNEDNRCLWSSIAGEATGREGIHLRGSVMMQKSEETFWDFYFLPLFNEDEATGCACVCYGPFEKARTASEHASFDVQITWTTFQGVIQWHKER